MKLQYVARKSPAIRAVNGTHTQTLGVYAVPLSIVDRRGQKRTFSRDCAAIDSQDDVDYEVLLGMPALCAENIVLYPYDQYTLPVGVDELASGQRDTGDLVLPPELAEFRDVATPDRLAYSPLIVPQTTPLI